MRRIILTIVIGLMLLGCDNKNTVKEDILISKTSKSTSVDWMDDISNAYDNASEIASDAYDSAGGIYNDSVNATVEYSKTTDIYTYVKEEGSKLAIEYADELNSSKIMINSGLAATAALTAKAISATEEYLPKGWSKSMTGETGEQLAEWFYAGRGWILVETNNKINPINGYDLVFKNKLGKILIVEVKSTIRGNKKGLVKSDLKTTLKGKQMSNLWVKSNAYSISDLKVKSKIIAGKFDKEVFWINVRSLTVKVYQVDKKGGTFGAIAIPVKDVFKGMDRRTMMKFKKAIKKNRKYVKMGITGLQAANNYSAATASLIPEPTTIIVAAIVWFASDVAIDTLMELIEDIDEGSTEA